MKLALFSGGDGEENTQMIKSMLELSPNKDLQITYIPSCSYDSELDFIDFVEEYKKFRIRKFIHFPIDIPFSEILKQEAFSSDIIFLGGGNTYYFLKELRKNKILAQLKKFVKKGGILAGESAGAIMTTPCIDMAGIPDFDRDDNDDNVRNFKALDLVPFEFFPHYKNSKRYRQELVRCSKQNKKQIYACSDGSGLIVKGTEIKPIGRVYFFNRGEINLVNSKKEF
jgi:dipeptidase E